MPLVMVRYKDPKVRDRDARDLAVELPALVAKHLGEPNTQADLKPDEVEVWVQPGHWADMNTMDVEVIVWATLYLEREANLDERRHRLKEDVQALVPPGTSGYVWVLLQPTSYEEWEGEN